MLIRKSMTKSLCILALSFACFGLAKANWEADSNVGEQSHQGKKSSYDNHDNHRKSRIQWVEVDLENGQLFIHGRNFRSHRTQVKLAGEELMVDSISRQLIVAWLPPGIISGDYRLVVASGRHGQKKKSSFDLTVGATGAQGEPGPAGPAGSAGPQGPIGMDGPQGPAGVQGDTGEPGPVGITGPQGPQGLTGPQGTQGLPGQPGAQGLRGPTGPAGPVGISGYQIVSRTTNSIGAFTRFAVTCPSGKRVIGGGAEALGPQAILVGSFPNGQSQWIAIGRQATVSHPAFSSPSLGSSSSGLRVFAICAVVR